MMVSPVRPAAPRTLTVDARHSRPGGRRRPSADVIEDVEWMIATGETHPETIAARLGLRTNSLYRALKRGGRRDIADVIRDRKPSVHPG